MKSRHLALAFATASFALAPLSSVAPAQAAQAALAAQASSGSRPPSSQPQDEACRAPRATT